MYYWSITMEGLADVRFLYRPTASGAAASAEDIWPDNRIIKIERCPELSDVPVEVEPLCGCGGVGSKRCAEKIAEAVESQAGIVAGPKTAAKFIRGQAATVEEAAERMEQFGFDSNPSDPEVDVRDLTLLAR